MWCKSLEVLNPYEALKEANTTDLKPCPCGRKAQCVSIPFTHDKYMVMCFNEGCGNSQDKWYDTKEEAIETWNRRVG